MEVFETKLPGIGVRYEFATSAGERIGVVVRSDGSRELLVYDRDDPDSCRETIRLGASESAALVELLGGSRVTERLADLRHEVEGLSIEWVTLGAQSSLAGTTIGEAALRTRTGASIVAVLRDEESIPGPPPHLVLAAGDVLLLMGTVAAVASATSLVRG